VVQPGLPLPWLSSPPCMLIAVNLFMHYYYVCTVRPGYIDEPPRYPGTSFLWASPSRPRRQLTTSGVRWSSPELEIVRANITRCKRCGEMRPEVSCISYPWAHGIVSLMYVLLRGHTIVAYVTNAFSNMTTTVLSVFDPVPKQFCPDKLPLLV
jgi:hypothetical protein